VNTANPPPTTPVAIIGIGCMFPQAADRDSYWANILNKVDAIGDVPATHWRPEDYFNADPKAPDLTYARRGGFLSPVDFPPLDFGISPNSLEATDSTQLLGLMVARQALEDAGYGQGRSFDRSRVSVILGVTGTLPLVIPLGARLGHPHWRRALKEAGVPDDVADKVVQRISDSYVGWQEESFPGLLGNVVAGRIANRLDLGGTNCVVDAACASSLSALHLAIFELATGRSDMVLTGGLDTFNDIFMYMCFSKTPALSPSGNAKPFDATADGTILGEGLGCLVIKRLADAERDKDRIYAVIRGIGTSSDGKGNAIYAPSPAGQTRALKQAYQLAGVTPDTIELVEAHGTGTRAGDNAEAAALAEVYRTARPDGSWCALGSVKSQIGHTKAAAGAAGLIKAALALHHKVLPPTIKVNRPIEPLAPGRSPFYVNTEKRPWLPAPDHGRRAAVSSFGFGGSNFHCVLEEYRPEKERIDWDGQTQIVAFSAATPEQLKDNLAKWPAVLPWDELRFEAARSRAALKMDQPWRLVIVLEKGKTDVGRLLAAARSLLDKLGDKSFSSSPGGVFLGKGSPAGKLAMLFPGQGSQYCGMGRDLACRFPQMQQALVEADAAFAEKNDSKYPGRLSDTMFPATAFSDEDRARNDEALRATNVAQPAIGAVSLGALRVLSHFGVRPDAVAGHSYGELVALHAAGRIDAATLHRLSRIRGQLMADQAGLGDRGGMLAVQGSAEQVGQVLREESLRLVVANKNSPRQTVLSGASAEIKRAADLFAQRKMAATVLPVSAAFHSAFVAEARQPFLAALAQVAFAPAIVPVFSNTTANVYPSRPDEARALLAGQLAEPVSFVDEIESMFRSGVRTFLEVGPGNKLTKLVDTILEGRSQAAMAMDSSSGQRNGIADLARALAQLAALGHAVDLTRWDDGIDPNTIRSAKKPALTVPICGANYVKPKQVRAAAAPELIAPAQPASQRPATIVAGVSDPGSLVQKVSQAPATATREKTSVTALPSSSTSKPAPTLAVDGNLMSQALRATQDNLLALQKMGEQTAKLHAQFLDNQNRALLTFQTLLEQQQRLLQGVPAASQPVLLAAPPPIVPAGPPPVIQATAPTPEPLVTMQASPPIEKPQIAPTPPPVPAPIANPAATVLLAIIAEKTGYPAEMLGLDMELDADLGIDSIKRVEIFSAVQEKLPQAPAIKPEHLGILRTLRQVVDFLGAGEQAAPVETARPQAVAETAKPQAASVTSSHLAAEILLTIVADKTGYPADMLGLDMELDADLGIDSIKRVEIFSAVQEKLPNAPAIKPEHLGTLRTLRQVVEFLGAGQQATPAQTATPQAAAETAKPQAATISVPSSQPAQVPDVPLKRYVLQKVELPAIGRKVIALPKNSEIWIGEDDGGLASMISARLGFQGHAVRVVSWKDLGTISRPSTLAGLIILAPTEADDRFLHNAFRLLQLAGPGLRQSAKTATAVFATVSRLDGAFGLNGLDVANNGLSGGLAGLAKTAQQEWPEVHCKAIDLPAESVGADEVVLAIVEELMIERPLEVGIGPNGSCALQLMEKPLDEFAASVPLAKGDVVVISGGARGVTAEAAVALARTYAPKLVLLGRSPEPRPEPDWLAPLSDEAAIKHALATRSAGATPKEIGEQCRGWLANREMLRTLQRIKTAGAAAIYRSVNICDAQAIRKVIAEVRAQLGPIKGMVHGAGVLADRKIEDKTLDQFESVYATKVAGARSLLAAIEGDELKVLAFFSSSTARFGRAGQVDYAMANEVLNKLAQGEARRRPSCRVVSLNWGPWDGGMVTPSLKGVFQNEGIGLIPLEAGGGHFIHEISATTDRTVEVVVLVRDLLPGGELTVQQGADAPRSPDPGSPKLATAFERPLSLELYPVLRSHVLASRAVLPMALTVELLAHAALHGNPGLVFHGFDELRVLKGVRLTEEQSCRLRVLAGKASKHEAEYRVPVELHSTASDGRDVAHARAVAVLVGRLPKATVAVPDISYDRYDRDIGEIYRDLLFHGADLQGIRSIEGLSAQGFAALAAAAPPASAWIKQPLRGTWLADPLVLDCAFQLMSLWSFENHGAFSLPSFAGRYRQYRRSFPADGVRIVAQVKQNTPHRALVDLWFVDRAGEVVAQMQDYECVIDASLNQAFRRNQLTSEVSPSV
jgi:acyl transferase domain-containing protein/NAD(P)-dependent dehydrogenase (short-subunit alcohol dehydrogenase family)